MRLESGRTGPVRVLAFGVDKSLWPALEQR
jgi:hypothetical protein